MQTSLKTLIFAGTLASAMMIPLASQAAMKLVCDGATATQLPNPSESTWEIIITNSPAGEQAKQLIFEAASKEAYFAAEEKNTSWKDRSFFWMNSPQAQPGEYYFRAHTAWGYDILSPYDLKQGRFMRTAPSSNLFKAFAQVINDGTRLRLVLESQRPFFSVPGGMSVTCTLLTDQTACRVQEYVFNNCSLQ